MLMHHIFIRMQKPTQWMSHSIMLRWNFSWKLETKFFELKTLISIKYGVKRKWDYCTLLLQHSKCVYRCRYGYRYKHKRTSRRACELLLVFWMVQLNSQNFMKSSWCGCSTVYTMSPTVATAVCILTQKIHCRSNNNTRMSIIYTYFARLKQYLLFLCLSLPPTHFQLLLLTYTANKK